MFTHRSKGWRATVVAFMLVSFGSPLVANELLVNGGMEGVYSPAADVALEGLVNGAEVAPGWRWHPTLGFSLLDFRRDTNVRRSGGAALRVEHREKFGGTALVSAPITGGVVAGRDYEFAVWVRTDRAELATRLEITDNDNWQDLDVLERSVAQATPDWRRLVMRWRADRTLTAARVAVRAPVEGRLWIDDASCRELSAADRDPAPPVGNLLRNASFEVGLDGWQDAGTRSSSVTSADAPQGQSILASTWFGGVDNRLTSWPFPLYWGHPHTVSAWVRTTGAAATVRIGVGELASELNKSESLLAFEDFPIDGTWRRVVFTFTPPPLPVARGFLVIKPPTNTDLRLDAMQVEVAPAAGPWASRDPIEAGIRLDRADGLFQSAEIAAGTRVTGTVRVYNHGAPVSLDLRRRTRDVWERARPGTGGQWTGLLLPSGLTTLAAVDFTPGAETGSFRAEVDVDEIIAPPCADALFSVLPPAPANNEQAPFGTHLDFDDSTTTPRTAGAGWTKTWRLVWERMVDPVEVTRSGSYLDRWRASGLNVLAVVGGPPLSEQTRPVANAIAWPGSWYSPANLDRARAYAHGIATTFGDRVAAWELMNEPDVFLHTISYPSRVAAYDAEAVAYATGLLQARPEARILAASATSDRPPAEWIEDVLDGTAVGPAGTPTGGLRLRQIVHGVSFHNYDGDPATTRRIVAGIRSTLAAAAAKHNQPSLTNLEIWDTEWSAATGYPSFRRETVRLSQGYGYSTARRAAASVAQGFIARAGEGVKASFLYHAYGPGAVNGSDFDAAYDLGGALRPTLAAQAAAARFLARAEAPAALSTTSDPALPAGTWGYRFSLPDGRVLLTAWADEFQTTSVNWTLPSVASLQVLDMMGNPLAVGPGDALPLGPEPVYVLIAAPTGPTADGLVAHWRMDEGAGALALDRSGQGRHASLNSPGTTWQAGRFGSALKMNGAYQINPGTPLTGASFTTPRLTRLTYSGWFYLTGEGGYPDTQYPRLVTLPGADPAQPWLGMNLFLRRKSNEPTYGSIGFNATFTQGTGDWRTADYRLVQLARWYHLAVTYDGGAISNRPVFFLDGVRQPTAFVISSPQGVLSSVAGPAWIGNRHDGRRPLDGLIDHVRLYDRILADAEIAVLAKEVPDVGVNQAPLVVLSAPALDSEYVAPATIVIEAEASDVDGNVAGVTFHAGGATIGAPVVSAPFTHQWTGVPPGRYVLDATVTDDQGLASSSAGVGVTVRPPPVGGLEAAPSLRGIELGWSPPSLAETDCTYDVTRATEAGSVGVEIASGLAAPGFVDTLVLPGETWHYAVTARANGVKSAATAVSARAWAGVERWRFVQFGGAESIGAAQDLADPDGDGRANFLEYALGEDPWAAAGSGGGPRVEIDVEGRLEIVFRRVADPQLSYTVQAGGDLREWSVIWSSSGVANEEGEVRVPDTQPAAGDSRRFLRLQVER